MEYTFINDNNTKVKVPHHNFTGQYGTRVEAEPCFRRIITYLIINNIIKNNIIDLGAWMGDNAIVWSLMVKDIVYAIDPSPENKTSGPESSPTTSRR